MYTDPIIYIVPVFLYIAPFKLVHLFIYFSLMRIKKLFAVKQTAVSYNIVTHVSSFFIGQIISLYYKVTHIKIPNSCINSYD